MLGVVVVAVVVVIVYRLTTLTPSVTPRLRASWVPTLPSAATGLAWTVPGGPALMNGVFRPGTADREVSRMTDVLEEKPRMPSWVRSGWNESKWAVPEA